MTQTIKASKPCKRMCPMTLVLEVSVEGVVLPPFRRTLRRLRFGLR